jgi:gp16 family phage-associated protein
MKRSNTPMTDSALPRDPGTSRKSKVENFFRTLSDSDMTVAEWARKNSFSRHLVYAVCHGHLAGARGQARQIARAIGLEVPVLCVRDASSREKRAADKKRVSSGRRARK